MKIDAIPEVFQSKIRLAIVTSLLSGEKHFSLLKEMTGATDGNLSVHLSKLEDGGFVEVKKEFLGKRPRSTYSLTDKGRKAFRTYVELLSDALLEE